jgi:hypothetical protein
LLLIIKDFHPVLTDSARRQIHDWASGRLGDLLDEVDGTLRVGLAQRGYDTAAAGRDSASASRESAAETGRRTADEAAALTEIERDRRQSERQERHENHAPLSPGRIIAELRDGTATASLFGSITVTAGYRVLADAQFATGGSTRIGLPSILHPNQPYDFQIEQWPPGSTQPVTKEIRFRFWPPIEGDGVDGWTCPCGRPTGESLDGPGHWEWRVPVVYNPPTPPASASVPPPKPPRRGLFR